MKKKIFNNTKFYNILFDKLFPIYRTLINKGYEKSLKELSKYINFRMIKIRSGKKVFDWIVPKEWELVEAYVKNSKNKKIIDFERNNLSVTSYSQPVNKILDLKDLKKKLYSLPNLPNAIPYTTTYYKKEWGFNISHNEKKKIKKR